MIFINPRRDDAGGCGGRLSDTLTPISATTGWLRDIGPGFLGMPNDFLW